MTFVPVGSGSQLHKNVLKASKDKTFKGVYSKFEDDGSQHLAFEDFYKRPTAVQVADIDTLKFFLSIMWGLTRERTFIHTTKETAFPSGYGIALQKSSRFKAAVDKWILIAAEFGLPLKWSQRAVYESNFYYARNMTEVGLIRDYIDTLPQPLHRGQAIHLSLHKLQSAFYVFFLASGISFSVLILEIFSLRSLKM